MYALETSSAGKFMILRYSNSENTKFHETRGSGIINFDQTPLQHGNPLKLLES